MAMPELRIVDDESEHRLGPMLNERLGMAQSCAAHRLARDLADATCRSPCKTELDPAFCAPVMMVEGMRPTNDAQAIIASQLAALGPLMLMATGEATRSTTFSGVSLWSSEAVKLARASALLADTLARLQRGGEQRVVVQHVDVRDGGQAIIGAVHPALVGGSTQTRGTTP